MPNQLDSSNKPSCVSQYSRLVNYDDAHRMMHIVQYDALAHSTVYSNYDDVMMYDVMPGNIISSKSSTFCPDL